MTRSVSVCHSMALQHRILQMLCPPPLQSFILFVLRRSAKESCTSTPYKRCSLTLLLSNHQSGLVNTLDIKPTREPCSLWATCHASGIT